MDKKGKGAGDIIALLAGIIVVAMGLSYFGVIPAGTFSLGGQEPAIPQEGATDGVSFCSDPSNTMTVGPMTAKWSPSTSMSSINAYLWLNGVKDGSKSDSSTKTIGYNDQVKLLYGYASTTYYSELATFNAPCRPFSSAELDNGAHELITADVDYTMNVFPFDTGDLTNGGISNETVGASDSGKWTIRVDADNEKGVAPITVGRPNSKIIVVAELNTTAWKEETATLTGVPGIKKYTGPLTASNTYVANSTQHSAVAWEMPGFPDITKGETKGSFDLTFTIESESGQDPKPNSNSGEIYLILYPQDWDLDPDTYQPIFGIEDVDGTYIGFSPDMTILYTS